MGAGQAGVEEGAPGASVAFQGLSLGKGLLMQWLFLYNFHTVWDISMGSNWCCLVPAATCQPL